MMDLREIHPELIRISPPDTTSHMGTSIRAVENHIFNAQINHSIEAMETDLEMGLSTIRTKLAEK